MGITRAIALIYCGISLALGCIYLLLASKKIKRTLHLLFAFTSLTIPMYTILTLLEYDAMTLAEYNIYMRIQIWFTAALIILIVWFVWKLANMQNRIFPVVLSIGITGVTVIRFLHPFYLLYSRLNA